MPFKEDLSCIVRRCSLVILGLVVAFSICLAQGGPWKAKVDMPTARMFLSSGDLDGKIYAIGGVSSITLLAVEMYDPATDGWTTKSDLPQVICGHSTCVVNGEIFVIGGTTSLSGTALSSVYVYHVATNTWTKKKDMPVAIEYASTSVANGKIYVIGGASSGMGEVYATVEEYDPATDTWTTKADMPTARVSLSTSSVDGKIYAIGGTVISPWVGMSTVEAYDPATDTWTTRANLLEPRWALSTSTLDGKIYAIGGDSHLGVGLFEYASVEEYDPVTDRWTRKTSMPTARGGHCSSVVNGKIYVIGGGHHNPTLQSLSTVLEYDPAVEPTGVQDFSADFNEPKVFLLRQNYPNPFNPSTVIRYGLPHKSAVQLMVYNTLGQQVGLLVQGEQEAGYHEVRFEGSGLSSGVYFYRLQAGSFVQTRKLVLLR